VAAVEQLERFCDDVAASSLDRPVRGRAAARAALLLVAIALAVIMTSDGSPVWQLVRLLAVVSLSTAAWMALDEARPTRVATAAVVGVVAFAAGIGIGIPHLLDTGWSTYTVAGTALLAAGLALLGFALVWWCQGARRLSWIPRVAALFAACALTTWTLGQSIAATNVPPTDLGATTPADVGLDYRNVEFRASDGVLLSGWYVPSRNGAAVVLLHGAGSTRSDVLAHAEVLARHGYGVLLYDARGHGRSHGRAMDFGWYGDEDIGGAVGHLSGLDDVEDGRIAAVGMSMGGEQAIGAAASVDGLDAVVAEGATNRVAGDNAWLSAQYGWRGAITEGIGALTYWFTDLLTAADPPITLHDAAQAAAPTPMLLIAAGSVAEEAQAGEYIRDGSPETVELWVAPDTGHTEALDVHPQEWEARVVAFLDDALAS
jgi:pimeloyl-ACP methyl ester carboxylesterase